MTDATPTAVGRVPHAFPACADFSPEAPEWSATRTSGPGHPGTTPSESWGNRFTERDSLPSTVLFVDDLRFNRITALALVAGLRECFP